MLTMKQFVVPVCLLLLAGCNRYTFTVNEQPVFNPPTLFSDYRIPDPALATCIEQAITDQQVADPRQLRNLNCSHSSIQSLKGVEIFAGLTLLDLSNNALSDIGPLLFLADLSMVNLDGNSSLNCSDADLLVQEVNGNIRLPEHCRK